MPHLNEKSPLIILVITALLLIVMVVVTSGHRDVISPVEGTLGDILTPVQGFMYRIATYVSNKVQSLRDRGRLEEDYILLQDRVLSLEEELLNQNEALRENERLRRLLDYKQDRDEYTITAAGVTGKNPGNWFNIFTIDKGTKQGLSVNMAVVSERGLVGRVIDTGSNWSKVRAVVDGQSAISGIVERTRDIGIVRGNNGLTFEDGLCRMVHLPMDSDIIPGDRVITSGLGEIFPKGIYIGEVVEVIHERRDLFKTAVIRPAADFRRLEEVLVIQGAME